MTQPRLNPYKDGDPTVWGRFVFVRRADALSGIGLPTSSAVPIIRIVIIMSDAQAGGTHLAQSLAITVFVPGTTTESIALATIGTAVASTAELASKAIDVTTEVT